MLSHHSVCWDDCPQERSVQTSFYAFLRQQVSQPPHPEIHGVQRTVWTEAATLNQGVRPLHLKPWSTNPVPLTTPNPS